MGEQPEADGIRFITLTPGQRRRLTFLRVTGLREVLFFLDCSVPGLRGRLRRVHSPWSPRR
ncbi:hypothetical protein [Modestobacter sp. SYSU DS0290]